VVRMLKGYLKEEIDGGQQHPSVLR
jgi:hypothetical protein